jgi:hypothetical protein
MIPRSVALIVLAGLITLPAIPGQEKPPPPAVGIDPPGDVKPQPAPVIKLAPQKVEKGGRALKYQLLPDPLDQVHGNAAPLWVRAGLAARGVTKKASDRQYNWTNAAEVPLAKLPQDEVREYLSPHANALRLAELAAQRDRCDWDLPPLTLQNLNDVIPLDEIQSLREIAHLLSLRCRLELAEGQFDKALGTLRIGFTLARHVGEADIVIQSLVGIAIAAVMLSRVEEMVQMPGSPNLYWALTTLPVPLVDSRPALRAELGTLYRSFPQLREAMRRPLSVEQVNHMVEEFAKSWGQIASKGAPDWSGRAVLAGLAIKNYPEAREYLLSQGRTAAQVDALPTLQVVVLYFAGKYDELRDEWLKWLNLPPWQAFAAMQANEKRLTQQARAQGNPLIALLFPALMKVMEAQMRLERQIAGLRCGEALRLYAAAHQGQPPPRLEAITEVPLPMDPFTGKGYEAQYRVQDGGGILDVPSPPRQAPVVGRRYELAPPKSD